MDKKLSSYRHRGAKSRDKRDGLEFELTLEESRVIFGMPCYYCGFQDSKRGIGMDRKDSSLGHTKNNVVSACKTCNYFLGSVPFEAKILFRDALRQCREKELLKNWKPMEKK